MYFFLPTLEDKALCSFEMSLNSKLSVTQHNIPGYQDLQDSVQFIGPAYCQFSSVFLHLSVLNSHPFVRTFPRSLHFVSLLFTIDPLDSHCYIYPYLAWIRLLLVIKTHTLSRNLLFCIRKNSQITSFATHTHKHTHTQTHTHTHTHSRTPLNQWSARHRSR